MPFFKATCVYFVLWLPTSSPSWFSALIKCLPIFCLWVFLLAHGFSFLGAHSSARKILAGLIFSALGDAFLIWQEQGYFVHGEEKSHRLHVNFISLIYFYFLFFCQAGFHLRQSCFDLQYAEYSSVVRLNVLKDSLSFGLCCCSFGHCY